MGHMREMHDFPGMDPAILEAAARRRAERKRLRLERFGESWSAAAETASGAQTEAPDASVCDKRKESEEALAAKLRRNPYYLVAMAARKERKARKKAEWLDRRDGGRLGPPA